MKPVVWKIRGKTGTTGTTPGIQPPHFPGYDVVAQRDKWDETTANVVLRRLDLVERLHFFTPDEAPTARALLDRLLGQDYEPRVPVLEMIDERLAAGTTAGDGYRYEDMPEDGDAFRASIAGLNADAREECGCVFHAAERAAQMDILENVQTTKDPWHGLPAAHVFNLWMRYACTAFYSHPWAWNEIGFGGPAYPRGYANLRLDGREPWERPEHHAEDPIPWVQRAESAKRSHAAREPWSR